MVTNFFLGANSSAGFRSLYEDFTAPEGNFDILVLKGGPGVGKSSFMKYIGSRAEEAGEDVERLGYGQILAKFLKMAFLLEPFRG